MSKLFLTLLATLFSFVFISNTAISQPVVPPPHQPYYHTYRVKKCRAVLVPFPHSKCEWVRVIYNYAPPPPPPRRYTPVPTYQYTPVPRHNPHPGHHPPPHHK